MKAKMNNTMKKHFINNNLAAFVTFYFALCLTLVLVCTQSL